MARLLYNTITSLDGYTADASGSFDWAAPSDDVHAAVNNQMRTAGTHLLGRRMWDVMRYWDTAPTGAAPGGAPLDEPLDAATSADRRTTIEGDFAGLWQASDRIVFSRSLRDDDVDDPHTRLEREFDPALVRALKASAAADLTIGGAELAGQALRAGLVDELQLFVVPVIVGGGKRALPADVRLELELIDERRFDDGVTFLGYRVRPSSG